MKRLAIAGVVLLACQACHGSVPAPETPATHAASHPAPATVEPALTSPRWDALLSHRPDLVLTVHPPAIARDPVYGPLLRRASELAAAYAGPTNLGTTTLAVVERTDEVVVAEADHGKEAVVVLRGVPAALDALDVVDTSGHPVWQLVHGDARSSSRELAPAGATASLDAALFVLPGLVWVIASGPAVSRVRAAVASGLARGALAGDDTPLVGLSLPGEALPQLRQGALATVGAGLLTIVVELMPGSTGLVVTKLTYTDTLAAASAEGTVLSVTLAFRHRLEEAIAAAERTGKPAPHLAGSLDWLGAAKVGRDGVAVIVRAPLPRPWLDALTHAELPAPGP